jgi:hypothetical protein
MHELKFGPSVRLGALSAWFRLKYPHLVHAAVASSAPVKAIVDFSDYLVVVNNSLAYYSPHCPGVFAQAIQQMQKLMKTKTGRRLIEKKFK